MSTAHSETGHNASADHHDHAFDGEPARELPPDEPRTPGWLPALGAALFVTVGALLLAQQSGDPKPSAPSTEGAEPAPSQGGDARPREVDIQKFANRRLVPTQPTPPEGTGAPSAQGGALQKLTPEQLQDLQKRIQQMRQRDGQPTAPAHP